MLVASVLRLLLRSALSDRRSAGMVQQARGSRVHERWAHLRFSVIGQLLAAPPAKGELKAAIAVLAARTWQHPTTGDPVQFGFATIERWYYRALKERADPVGVLRRKLRADAGRQVAISDAVRQAVLAQYAAHKSWSVQLHHDNLVALAETRPELEPAPSYATLRRFMSANGLARRRRVTARRTDGAERAEARIAEREVRGYEAEYVNALWHWDCHHGSRKVLTRRGEWATPILFGVLDDRSRLACHLQWYLAETAEIIAHGLSQAFQKRGLPRSALSDNGAAMTAAEITEGLTRLGVLHHTTLPYSPYQYVAQSDMWRRLREDACGALKPTAHATYSSMIDQSRHQRRRIDHARRAVQVAGYCRSLSGRTICRGPRALPAAGKRGRVLPLDAGADRLGAADYGEGRSERGWKHQLHTAEELARPTYPAGQWPATIGTYGKPDPSFRRGLAARHRRPGA
jgi:transposase InsO family protein